MLFPVSRSPSVYDFYVSPRCCLPSRMCLSVSLSLLFVDKWHHPLGYTMDQQKGSHAMMDEFIGKLRELQRKAGYSSRIVYKIQDLFDLRERQWTKKVFKEFAKSVAEIREDVNKP